MKRKFALTAGRHEISEHLHRHSGINRCRDIPAQDGHTHGRMSLFNPTPLKVDGCLFGACQDENWSRSN